MITLRNLFYIVAALCVWPMCVAAIARRAPDGYDWINVGTVFGYVVTAIVCTHACFKASRKRV